MGMTTAILTAASVAIAAASSYAQSRQQASQAKYQSAVASANAQAARQQAFVESEKGRINAENYDREREELRRNYESTQGSNVAGMGAMGVDITSGSALDVLTGNARLFSADVGTNRYQKAVAQWEANEAVKQQNYQADQYDAQASYLSNSASSIGQSLFTAGLAGLGAGLSTFGASGGFTKVPTGGDKIGTAVKSAVNKGSKWVK